LQDGGDKSEVFRHCKAAGIALCLAGILVTALYVGSSLSPLTHSHHGILAGHGDGQPTRPGHVSKGLWITGTFLMLLACVAWSLWIVSQVITLTKGSHNIYFFLNKLRCKHEHINMCFASKEVSNL
jgi:hypothetical protein